MERDKHGNVKCEKCGRWASETFKKCPHCCEHNELELDEGWHGSDEEGGWELEVVCLECGKNYDFDNDWLIENFKLVRK